MIKGILLISLILLSGLEIAHAAATVPNEIQQPGTQPLEIQQFDPVSNCAQCHGGYDQAVEPYHNWIGSMMAQAGRDPIFWSTMAIAEQDFDGSGDLCLRCHTTKGWIEGRSTPTDGSGLLPRDDNGVECDFCHRMTNPDNSEHPGVQNPPFLANNFEDPNIEDPNIYDPDQGILGYYASGMYVLWDGGHKLGPYAKVLTKHPYLQSKFHRSVDFCGTCHDVSNPAVGDLALNNGAQVPLLPGTFSGILGTAVDGKAAFNNFPYMYGIVERTFSEYKAGKLSKTLVSDYLSLPADLQAGALKTAYDSAMLAGTGGNYEDGTSRYFSCQSCHLRPVTGKGALQGSAPTRNDLPLHDMTGGNYWMAGAIQYLDAQNKLVLGGPLSQKQINGMNDGAVRALKQLSEAASLSVNGNTLKVINLCGHKLISGYPEGRRMWLNIKWFDSDKALLREDGKYGPLFDAAGNPVMVMNPATGKEVQVESILDLKGTNTRIYEVHPAVTQEWAAKLIDLGYPADLALSYDRYTGAVDRTLGQLAAQAPGTYYYTFHFVLNNKVASDNRIPPYGMAYDEAKVRNILPVPDTQYGNPGKGKVYNYWDEVSLNPPANAKSASFDLLYQPTSWEYIQFLYLANNGQNALLGQEGVNMLEAWLNTDMAIPIKMKNTTWQPP
jgi:hypothetical protein